MIDAIQHACVYLAMVAGIIVAEFGEEELTHKHVKTAVKIIFAASIAVTMTARSEHRKGPNAETHKQGRRRNFSGRMFSAFSHGVAFRSSVGYAAGE